MNESKRVTLEELIRGAQSSAIAEAAQHKVAGARAERLRAHRAWWPKLQVDGVVGPSPDIDCFPTPEQCTSTEPSEVQLRFEGVYYRFEAQLLAPLLTFGKLGALERAADAGLMAVEALRQAKHGDLARDASRAYYAVKLGRELIFMLEEGLDLVRGELASAERALEEGEETLTETDLHRLRTVRAEIEARLAEARSLEGAALAGVRLLYGDPDVDIDEEPLDAVDYTLTSRNDARAAAEQRRPEVMAAGYGAEAAKALTQRERARSLPDLLLVGRVNFARAQGVDDPKNTFYRDPFNDTSALAGFAMRWNFDTGDTVARVRQAAARSREAETRARYAAQAVSAEAERSWAAAKEARVRLEASRQGARASRAWLVATQQSAAIGLMEPRDLADALINVFNMRARIIQATFDWNVAVAALKRATASL